VCGHEVLSYGDSGDEKHWLFGYQESPAFLDISDWFNYDIPANSHDDCVNYPGLFYNILDYDCKNDVGSSLANTVWKDTEANHIYSQYLFEDSYRYTNIRLRLDAGSPIRRMWGCIKINTRGQINIERKFNIEVCGLEKVLKAHSAAPISGIYDMKETAADRAVDSYEVFFEPLAGYISKFSVDSEQCPIVKYELYERVSDEDSAGFAYERYDKFTNPEESPDGVTLVGDSGFEGLLVFTEKPFHYKNLYIRATTESELYPAYLPVNIKICGNETLTAKSREVEYIYMTQFEPRLERSNVSLSTYFTNSDP